MAHNGVPMLTRENILTIVGEAKSCKTFLCSAFAVAAFCGQYMSLTSTAEGLTVLYVDTEQAELMTQKIAKRMQTMVEREGEEWDDDGLVLLNVRKLSYEERK